MITVICSMMLAGALLMLLGLRTPTQRASATRLRAHPGAVVACAIAGGCVGLIVTALPSAAVLSAMAAGFLPSLHRKRRHKRRVYARRQAWPHVLDDMTSALRAGLNLPEALSAAGRRAPHELRPSFDAFSLRYAQTGDFRTALEAMRVTVADPVFDGLAHSLLVAREVGGGDLTHVLRSLASFTRADLQLRGELLARQSWSVNSARMAVAAPWVVLLMLASRPSTITAYRTFEGAFILGAVAVLSVIAYVAMIHIARLEEIA